MLLRISCFGAYVVCRSVLLRMSLVVAYVTSWCICHEVRMTCICAYVVRCAYIVHGFVCCALVVCRCCRCMSCVDAHVVRLCVCRVLVRMSCVGVGVHVLRWCVCRAFVRISCVCGPLVRMYVCCAFVRMSVRMLCVVHW